MSLIGSVNGLSASPYTKLTSMLQADGVEKTGGLNSPKALGLDSAGKAGEAGFSNLFDNMIQAVDAKQASANNLSKQVLLGNNDQLHQSVIAMQEASVAFSLMVEVRNKLVDSYQELMRMPV